MANVSRLGGPVSWRNVWHHGWSDLESWNSWAHSNLL